MVGILCIIFGGFYLFIHIAFEGIFTGPSYDKEDLIENFEKRKREIFEAKDYFVSIVPENIDVKIEFKDNEIGIFHIRRDSIRDNNWHLDINSKKTDSLLYELNWTKAELKILKSKLDKANCVSAQSGNPVTIGWQRSGMGMFFYNLFEQNLSDSLISKHNDGCISIFYKDNVVLEYGGGAIGPQCFPSFYKNR